MGERSKSTIDYNYNYDYYVRFFPFSAIFIGATALTAW